MMNMTTMMIAGTIEQRFDLSDSDTEVSEKKQKETQKLNKRRKQNGKCYSNLLSESEKRSQ